MNMKIVPISFEEYGYFEVHCDYEKISFLGYDSFPKEIIVEPGIGHTVLLLASSLIPGCMYQDLGCLYIEVPEATRIYGIRKDILS